MSSNSKDEDELLNLIVEHQREQSLVDSGGSGSDGGEAGREIAVVLTGEMPATQAAAAETASKAASAAPPGWLTSMALDFVPVVGQIKAGVQLIVGRDLVTGEPVNRYTELVGILPAGKLLKLGGTAMKTGTQALCTRRLLAAHPERLVSDQTPLRFASLRCLLTVT